MMMQGGGVVAWWRALSVAHTAAASSRPTVRLSVRPVVSARPPALRVSESQSAHESGRRRGRFAGGRVPGYPQLSVSAYYTVGVCFGVFRCLCVSEMDERPFSQETPPPRQWAVNVRVALAALLAPQGQRSIV